MNRRQQLQAPPPNSQDIAHRIRVARAALGLGEKEAAARVRVSLRPYRRLETNGPRLTVEMVLKVAHAFDLSIDWLVDGDGNMSRHQARTDSNVVVLPVRQNNHVH